MIGIDVHSSIQMNEAIFLAMRNLDSCQVCYVDTYELIQSDQEGEIQNPSSPKAIQEIVKEKQNHFINARFFMYAREKDIVEIERIDEYASSQCRCVILVIDAHYMEIYAKDEKWLEKCFNELCIRLSDDNVKPIYTMERKTFSIF